MEIRDEILRLINRENPLGIPVTDTTHLYRDLRYDSLRFIQLLLCAEEQFGVTIEVPEMEDCLIVGRLIELVQTKVRGKGHD